jgi:type I restriction enzyme S subunit
VKYENLSGNDVISFVPMEVLDEKDGKIAEQRTTTISKTKGFTKFKENDLIWAKITPCMQNGKSAIARNLVNGYGCGSTEFYVLRPKTDNVLIEYIHFILRDKRVLESAKNSFGGSAGQQRVSSGYLKSIQIPLPPKEIQQQIVDLYTRAVEEKQAKEQESREFLAGIDDYLLKELGIELPENVGNERYFEVSIEELIGGRLDVEYYNGKNKLLLSFVKQSKFELQPLDSITSLITNGQTPKSSEYSDAETEYPIIKAGSYTDDAINLEKVDYCKKKQTKKVEQNDIFILAAAHQADYVGKQIKMLNNQPEKDTSFVGELLCVRSNEKSNPMFLFNCLQTNLYKQLINREKRGQTSHIYPSDIKNIMIPVPPIEKQNEIAEHIQSIRTRAKRLQEEGREGLERAKVEIEKMII